MSNCTRVSVFRRIKVLRCEGCLLRSRNRGAPLPRRVIWRSKSRRTLIHRPSSGTMLCNTNVGSQRSKAQYACPDRSMAVSLGQRKILRNSLQRLIAQQARRWYRRRDARCGRKRFLLLGREYSPIKKNQLTSSIFMSNSVLLLSSIERAWLKRAVVYCHWLGS